MMKDMGFERAHTQKAVRLEDVTLGSETKIGSRLQRLNPAQRCQSLSTHSQDSMRTRCGSC